MTKANKNWLVIFILGLVAMNLFFRNYMGSVNLFVIAYAVLTAVISGYFMICWLKDFINN